MNMFIIDTSYVTYHCMFSAAKAVFGDSNLVKLGYAEDYDPLENQDYVDMLYSKFTDIVDNRERVTKCDVPMSNVLFAIDCNRNAIWRKDIFPDYKAQRDEKAALFNTTPSKLYITNTIVPLYVEQGAISIQTARAEADDIVGVIVEGNRDHDMHYVITSDKDYLQLTGKNYKQFDANGNEIKPVSLFKDVAKSSKYKDIDFTQEIKDLTSDDMIFFKAMMGDKSDNINPMHVRCGPVKAYKYLRDKAMLSEQWNNTDGVREQLMLNLKLMKFKYIPTDIRNDITYIYSKERSAKYQ